MTRRPRVLVVDDSAFARKVLTKLLEESGEIEVVGKASDGVVALEQIEALDPDVITLDLMMPELDGIGVLRALAGRARPRAIVVSISGAETDLGVEALMLGAVDVVLKPTALASERLTAIGAELVAKVLGASARHPARLESPKRIPSAPVSLVVVGTSTGGPQALSRLLASLPSGFPAPIAIALHIPEGYTESLAARLDRISNLHVVEAADGLELTPGLVVLARGGSQLRIARRGTHLHAHVFSSSTRAFSPSVDELFTSAAVATGAATLGVVLTGMGDDGLAGARLITDARGAVVTESASSCVVYGMPRVVDEAGLSAASVSLDEMAGELERRVPQDGISGGRPG